VDGASAHATCRSDNLLSEASGASLADNPRVDHVAVTVAVIDDTSAYQFLN